MAVERVPGLVAVLDGIRREDGVTQPLLAARVGLGRSVVAQRVAELEAAGLVESDGLGPSTGGRAPRRLRLRAQAGAVVGIDIVSTELVVGLADLAGRVLARRQQAIDVADGPEAVLGTAERLVDELLAEQPDTDVWAVGVGVPGPVEFRTGLPVAPPIMPGWDRYPIRERLGRRYDAPVWVDNDVNLLALAERRSDPAASAVDHLLFVRIGTGIGAALVVDGQLYRGANGSAGDVGHVAIPQGGDVVCRCGNVGCLEAVAGGSALARDGRLLAETRQSPALAAVLAETGTLREIDVTVAAEHGDPAARALLQRSARLIGGTLATLVSFFNPELLVLGGGIARARAHVLPAIRETIYQRALPLSTQDLRIEVSAIPEELAGITGAVHLALDQVFSEANLPAWLSVGSPAGLPGIGADEETRLPA